MNAAELEEQRTTARSINAQVAELQKPIRRLECCCCGSTTRGRQWWNRDEGYGLCPKCAGWISGREAPEDMQRAYGAPGINHSISETS